MMSARNWPPFTASQWQELEHQALIFKYMVSGVPIPPDLLIPLKRNLVMDSSPPPPPFSSRLFPHQPPSKLILIIYKSLIWYIRWVFGDVGVFGFSGLGVFSDGSWEENRPRAREVQEN